MVRRLHGHDPSRPGFAGAAAPTWQPRPCTTSSCATSRAGGYDVPRRRAVLSATGRSPSTGPTPGLVDVFAADLRRRPSEHWRRVRDLPRSSSTSRTTFQQWRFRHLQVVAAHRSATRPGTGGSSGVAFLRRALDLTFFPELYEVRTRIGWVSAVPHRCHLPRLA